MIAGKTEAITTLKIINKGTTQGEDLAIFFEFCKDFGVSNARDTPQFVRIPKEEVEAIEKTINNDVEEKPKKEETKAGAIVVLETLKLKTIITDKWEVFEEDQDYYFNEKSSKECQNPLPFIVLNQPLYIEYPMPDLITF